MRSKGMPVIIARKDNRGCGGKVVLWDRTNIWIAVSGGQPTSTCPYAPTFPSFNYSKVIFINIYFKGAPDTATVNHFHCVICIACKLRTQRAVVLLCFKVRNRENVSHLLCAT